MAFLLLLALSACSTKIEDTEGHRFELVCDQQPCRLRLTRGTKTDGSPREGGKESTYSVDHEGRLLLACPGGDEAQQRSCRPLECESGSACVKLGGADFACDRGLCQASSRELTSLDRSALCLAGTGDWEGSREQRSLSTLARSCRPPCEVPAKCRQP